MKVKVTKKAAGKFDVRIKRTRKSEGDSVRARGLSRAELKAWLKENIEAIAPVPLRGM